MPLSVKTAAFRALRFCFRAVPLSEGRRDKLRQYFLDHFAGMIPRPQIGRVGPAVHGRRPVESADGQAIGHVGYRQEPLPDRLPATLVAFYLPQFHRIRENDEWWGKGFTEWQNVARALPQFEGHIQPKLPGDLGFYDLRNPQVMRDQVQLAREYGIGAFCFYFYWFGGKTLLEEPLQHLLDDKSIDLPFCLCWANENWSRRWDGRPGEVLIEQNHGPEDDIAFISHIARYLRDPRYLRVEGKPMLLVYRPGQLPDATATARRWRHWCNENGIGDIHLVYVQSFERPDPADIGFDAAAEFPPNLSTPTDITAQQTLLNPHYRGEALDWRDLPREYGERARLAYTLYPGVNCGWDNEARRTGRGRTLLHASPRRYGEWLRLTIDKRLSHLPAPQRLIFINAWNEWAEGAVLEPDSRLGHAWLQATRAAVSGAPKQMPDRPCVVIHAWHLDAFAELCEALASNASWRLIVTTSPDRAEDARKIVHASGLEAQVEIFENRGRDILPFLRVANRLLDEGEDVVLKLHTKKSLHRQDGDAWRRELVSRLLPDRQTDRLFLFDEFRRKPELGILAPDGHLQPISYFWGLNENNVHYLAHRLGVPVPDPGVDTFVSGSMFWMRLSALRPLLDAHLGLWEFEPEEGQVDGTMAHAVERVFALAARSAGYQVQTVAEVCGLPSSRDGDYRYAARW
jgi:lipopolysaccharide biosynthesis protein